MTDDSAALKSALKTVWPVTKQMLCHFHVGQAEWRWLTSKVNNIPADDRQSLMRGFQQVAKSLPFFCSLCLELFTSVYPQQ